LMRFFTFVSLFMVSASFIFSLIRYFHLRWRFELLCLCIQDQDIQLICCDLRFDRCCCYPFVFRDDLPFRVCLPVHEFLVLWINLLQTWDNIFSFVAIHDQCPCGLAWWITEEN
jgi:hypothetical protein